MSPLEIEGKGESGTHTLEGKGESGTHTLEGNGESGTHTLEGNGESGTHTLEGKRESGTLTLEGKGDSGTHTLEGKGESGTHTLLMLMKGINAQGAEITKQAVMQCGMDAHCQLREEGDQEESNLEVINVLRGKFWESIIAVRGADVTREMAEVAQSPWT